jgi:uncharacterized damage-inducible protein DinB
MTDPAEFLSYWKNARARTRRVASVIPEPDVEWAPASTRWTFGDIVRHVAGIERYMFAENVRGQPSRYPGHDVTLAAGRDAIIAYLDRCHAETLEILGALSAADMEARCETPGGASMARWKWLRSMAEHEAHHRGQLYMMLGLRGISTPPLYGLTEEEVLARSIR